MNSPTGREPRSRGLNAKVVVAGRVRLGDVVRRLSRAGRTTDEDQARIATTALQWAFQNGRT